MSKPHQQKLTRTYNPQDTFLFQLSQQQMKTLSYLLPKGCSLVASSKSRKSSFKLRHDQNSMMHNQSSSMRPASIAKQTSRLPLKMNNKKPAKQQLPQSMKPLLQILNQLKNHKNAWPFLQPVDANALGVPQYYEIISQPMDLSTIQKKLLSNTYKSPQQFYRDVNLMIKNSYVFNQANQQFLKLTNEYEKYFFRIAGPQSKPTVDKKLQKQREKQRQRLQRQRIKQEKLKQKLLEKQKQRQRKLLLQQQQQAQLALRLAKKKKKFIPKDILQAQNISVQQKQQLANNIHNLPKQHLKGIRNIVFDASKMNQDGQVQTISQNEFDIQKIGYKKIRQLQKYVKLRLLQVQASKYSTENHEKKQEVDLDELQSQWTSQFVD